MKKAKRKHKSEPEMDPHTKAVIEEAIRIRTRMLIRDKTGNTVLFRSTIAEDQGEEAEEDEEDSG